MIGPDDEKIANECFSQQLAGGPKAPEICRSRPSRWNCTGGCYLRHSAEAFP
jgi:hypothetical protein